MATNDSVSRLQDDLDQIGIDFQLLLNDLQTDSSTLAAALASRDQTAAQLSATITQLGQCQAQVADLQAQLAAVKGPTRPTGGTIVAGTAVPYIPIESLGFGPGADPNKIIAAMTTPGVLTFPPGFFPITGFGTGYVTGLNIPHGPTAGTNGYCFGVVGSGAGSLDQKTSGTYFGLVTGSSRLTNSTDIVNSYVLKAADVNAIALGQFRVVGSEQGHRFSGMSIRNARSACHLFDLAVNGWSGDANVPPGETPGFSFFDLKDGVRRDHLIERLECDGRRLDGKSYGSAPFGGQDMNGSVWNDCYGHDATASQVGFFRCRNVTTNRLRVERNGTGTGTKSGQGINHESTDGIIHNNPYIDVPRANGNNGTHISHSNYGGTSPYAPGRLTINDPVVCYDGVVVPTLVAQSWAPFVATNTAKPVVTVNGQSVTITWAHG